MLRRKFLSYPVNSHKKLVVSSSLRFFSSSSLNPPPGVSSHELLSSIKESHHATANLRMAEQQRNQEAEIMRQQTQKYRDGLLQETKEQQARAGGAGFMSSSKLSELQQQQENTSSSSELHYSVPSNPLAMGRDQLVLSLWQSILSGRRALFLTGPDGVGASTVASQFAEQARRSGRFSCIHWFDCARTKSNVSQTGSNVATSVHPPTLDQLREFVAKMRKRKEDEVLLVFDQCENAAEVLKALHSIFVAMKQEQQHTSSDSTQQKEGGEPNTKQEEEDPASPAKYLFSGPPKLSAAESRSHYSRLHLLFVVPQKVNSQKAIVNPLDELLDVTVSVSHRQGAEINTNTLTLASEFCPGVVNVEPLDDVPALLLAERFIQNHITEYQRHQESVENGIAKNLSKQESHTNNKNKNNNFDDNDDENNTVDTLRIPPPALHDTHLQRICEAVVNVPLLIQLASNFVASQLMVHDRVRSLARAGEVLVGEEEQAVFKEIVDDRLLGDLIAERSCKNKSEVNPQGVLSLSTAAAELCFATIDTILSSSSSSSSTSSSKMIITPDFVKTIVFSIVSMNISNIASAVVEALIVEVAKNGGGEGGQFESIAKFIGESSQNREDLVTDVVMILRRCGVLSDSMISSSKSIDNFNTGNDDSVVTNHQQPQQHRSFSKSIEEEVFSCHACLADGLLMKKSSSSSSSSSATETATYKALLNLFVKATARNDLTARLQIAKHVAALMSKDDDVAQNTSSASSSTKNNIRIDLFDRVANFLASEMYSSTFCRTLAKELWMDVFKNNNKNSSSKIQQEESDSSSSSFSARTASRVALDLGRLLSSEFEFKTSKNLFTNVEESDRALSEMAEFLETASAVALGSSSSDNVVATKNVVWAQLTALRARLLDPASREILPMLSNAAQILENELESPQHERQQQPSMDSKELIRLAEEHLVLLVAWAEAARFQNKEVSQKHRDKMKRIFDTLESAKKATKTTTTTTKF